MASPVILSAAVRSNLVNLQTTADLKARVQQRLSTGKKVSSVLDDPAAFFTAAALTTRANDLTRLLDGLSSGLETLKAADAGLDGITSSIAQLQSNVRQARQDKSYKAQSIDLDPTTIGTAALKTISFTAGGIGATTIPISLNDQVTLTGGAFPAPTLPAGAAGTVTVQAADLNGGTAVSVALSAGDTISTIVAKINAATGTRGVVAADNGAGRLKLTDDYANAITIGGTAASLTAIGLTAGTTATVTAGTVNSVDELVDKINANASLVGKVTASNDNGRLRIVNQSTIDLTVTGVGAVTGKIDGSGGTRIVGGNDVRQSLATQFNDIRTQLDRLADDAGYNGVNLLKGDKLKLAFNETGSSSLTVQSKTTTGVTAANLGITAATAAEFGSDDLLDQRLTQLDAALSTLRAQSSAFGSNLAMVETRQDFTKALTQTLQAGADQLTLADTNEEGANLLALNTRQQLQTTSLSFAAQADQAVLQFLR